MTLKFCQNNDAYLWLVGRMIAAGVEDTVHLPQWKCPKCERLLRAEVLRCSVCWSLQPVPDAFTDAVYGARHKKQYSLNES